MRNALRFKPDPLDTAKIQFNDEGEFNPSDVGLVLDQSYTGCAIVLRNSEADLSIGLVLRIKVGNLNFFKARIAWVRSIDSEGIKKVGIEFLE